MKRVHPYAVAMLLLLTIVMLVSCSSSQVQGNTLTLYAVYKSNADFFEMEKDISVATDKEFSHLLRIRSCIPDNEQDRYIYTYEWNDPVNVIYIKPPIIYIPVEFEMVSTSISEGSTVMTSDGKPWFTITGVTVINNGNANYKLTVSLTPIAEDLPRSPEIVIGNLTFRGMTQHNFNESNVFDFGEFSFDVAAVNADEIEKATLCISQALIKSQPESMAITSNIESLEIIIVD